MQQQRLNEQIDFLMEIDKLKTVLRQSCLIHADRRENAAEHSWHVAVMAMLLAEYAAPDIDRLRVLHLLLIHDIVEIDAGDTYCYDADAMSHKVERETRAAQRIFGLLPPEQGAALQTLWQEFEAQTSREAQFANAVDRLMPILHNYHTQGRSWRAHGVSRAQVLAHNGQIRQVSEDLWRWVETLLEEAVARGYLCD